MAQADLKVMDLPVLESWSVEVGFAMPGYSFLVIGIVLNPPSASLWWIKRTEKSLLVVSVETFRELMILVCIKLEESFMSM